MRTLTTSMMAASVALTLAQGVQPPAGSQDPPRQQGEVSISITGPPGLPPKYAVPDFIALTNDTETVAAAKTSESRRAGEGRRWVVPVPHTIRPPR